jgi:hypothetical protein
MIFNNEDWTDSWDYEDASLSPISLQGLTLIMMVRKTAGDTNIELAAANDSSIDFGSVPTGVIATGGTGLNVLALAISKGVIKNLEAGPYVFEVQATGDGITRTIANGPLTVNQGVIR